MPKTNFSKVVAGVMNWGQWGAKLSKQEMGRLIQACVEQGVTTFDNADIYGGHTTEKEFGEACAFTEITREKIQIITKCGIAMPSESRRSIKTKYYDTSKRYIIQCVENSLKDLRTNYVDLLLIHRPSPLMNPTEIMKAIEGLRESGKVKHFGVSNFTQSQVKLINSALEIKVNQIEISPFNLTSFLDGTLDDCLLHKIIPMAWSPLGGGKLFAPTTSSALMSQRMRLKGVAEKYGWEMDEMIYLFLFHHPAGIYPVVGSSRIERIKIAVESAHTIITDAQWFEIWTAATGKEVP